MSQPPPKKNEHPAVWDVVIKNQLENPYNSFVQEFVVPDMQKRHLKGLETYGVALQPHNGRDALTDAYEEALDLLAYTTQLDMERGGYLTLIDEITKIVVSLRADIYHRDKA
jgi:hypothetical protein